MVHFVAPSVILTVLYIAFVSTSGVNSQKTTESPKAKRLPFTAKLNPQQLGAHNILAADRARIEHIKADATLRKAGHDGAFAGNNFQDFDRAKQTINVTNAGIIYTASVNVGGVSRELLIDTGSSNTWVGALEPYHGNNCSSNLFFIIYGSGIVLGKECFDEVRLSDDLIIANQSFGNATIAIGFSNVDGILGIGPVALTNGTVTNTTLVPTVTDNLYAQGKIEVESIGIFYAPTTNSSVVNGELTFGGVDETKLAGYLAYTPLTTTTPAKNFWGVDQTVSYGDEQILPLSAGIVDTGTTLVYLATDAYNQYVNATGAILDANVTGLLTITEDQYAKLQPLVFNIGTAGSYSLSPNAQIWPRSLNSLLHGNESAIYLIVANLGTPSGQGMDFIDGYTFLERYYTVYDTTNSRFGIAPTEFTNATTN